MSSPLKEWTIMVYMAGDNNLSRDMAYSIRALQDTLGSLNGSANVLLYFDGRETDTPSLYFDFTEPDAPIYQAAIRVPPGRSAARSARPVVGVRPDRRGTVRETATL